MEMPGVKTLIRIRDGGLFFQAGHRHKGGMMILAISATTTGNAAETPTRPRPPPANPTMRQKRSAGSRGSRAGSQ